MIPRRARDGVSSLGRPADPAFFAANFSSFEIEDESLLTNLREYSLANSLYWALCEGHACEISARRNAMDVSLICCSSLLYTGWPSSVGVDADPYVTERFQERW